MSSTLLVNRYAKALFDLLSSGKDLSKAEQHLSSLMSLLDESDDFKSFIGGSVVSKAKQSSVVSAIADKSSLLPKIRDFILVVVQNGRLSLLPDIIERFFAIAKEQRGEVDAKVTSAIELDNKSQKAIQDSLASCLGAKVNLEIEVDKEICGGLIVQVGSKMLDASLLGKLRSIAAHSKTSIQAL